MSNTTDNSNQRRMLRAYDSERIVAEKGQPLSDQQALALAIQYLAGSLESAAEKLLEAAKHRG